MKGGRVRERKASCFLSCGLHLRVANAPATLIIFMKRSLHESRARFIGTAKRTGKA
jgi:hypothetical protein